MTNIAKLVGATAFLGLAVPVAAQDPYNYPQGQYQPQYPQQYPQQYPGQPVQTQPYPGQQYGYPQSGYGNNSVGQIIDQLLGNRYSVTDRQAIHQCANAAISQSSAQFGGGSGGGYNHPYGYNQQYGYNRFQVTAITDVERRSNGLRVKGLLDSGRQLWRLRQWQYRLRRLQQLPEWRRRHQLPLQCRLSRDCNQRPGGASRRLSLLIRSKPTGAVPR